MKYIALNFWNGVSLFQMITQCRYKRSIVKRVPVNFQQKTNISPINWLDPKTFLSFSARTRYSKWWLFCIVYYILCWKYIWALRPSTTKQNWSEIGSVYVLLLMAWGERWIEFITIKHSEWSLSKLVLF